MPGKKRTEVNYCFQVLLSFVFRLSVYMNTLMIELYCLMGLEEDKMRKRGTEGDG